HCVPAQNLFEASAMPLLQCPTTPAQLLRAEGYAPEVVQVHQVCQVTGVAPGRGRRLSYPSFESFIHAGPGGDGLFYRLQREASPLDGAADTYLTLQGAADLRPQAVAPGETLSVAMLCTNRLMLLRLGVGDVCHLAEPGIAKAARNVSPVSAPLQPAAQTRLIWDTVAQLAHGHGDFRTAEGLRRYLRLFTARHPADHAATSAHAQRIAALRSLHEAALPELVCGAPQLTCRTTLTLDRSGFASEGDAYLFGQVLRALAEDAAAVQTRRAVAVCLQPSGRTWRWPARAR
ncbi:MAG: hypothetical protein EOO40_06690, partial [Deltaproteobacteria bacterium]